MTVMILLGGAAGAGLWALLVVARPPKTDPVVELAQIDAVYQAAGRRSWAAAASGGDKPGPVVRLGAWTKRISTRYGVGYTSITQDAALTGRSMDAVLGVKIAGGLGGFVAVLLASALWAAAGLPMAGVVALALAVTVGVGAFFIPDLDVRATAATRREDFRRGLAAYLDWVQLEMAGSAAPAEALPVAARLGAGWPFALIRDTLYQARRAGVDAWQALSELGERIGVDELKDFGQLIGLAAADGAQVRSTLSARAASMRQARTAEQTGQAGRKDQSMEMAQIILGLGLMLFIGYPAVVNIFSL